MIAMHRLTPRLWNRLLEALILVRLGQELGSDSRIARAVHDFIVAVLAVVK